MSGPAPDYFEPVIGWRSWRSSNAGVTFRLRSIALTDPWPVREALAADVSTGWCRALLRRRAGHAPVTLECGTAGFMPPTTQQQPPRISISMKTCHSGCDLPPCASRGSLSGARWWRESLGWPRGPARTRRRSSCLQDRRETARRARGDRGRPGRVRCSDRSSSSTPRINASPIRGPAVSAARRRDRSKGAPLRRSGISPESDDAQSTAR